MAAKEAKSNNQVIIWQSEAASSTSEALTALFSYIARWKKIRKQLSDTSRLKQKKSKASKIELICDFRAAMSNPGRKEKHKIEEVLRERKAS